MSLTCQVKKKHTHQGWKVQRKTHEPADIYIFWHLDKNVNTRMKLALIQVIRFDQILICSHPAASHFTGNETQSHGKIWCLLAKLNAVSYRGELIQSHVFICWKTSGQFLQRVQISEAVQTTRQKNSDKLGSVQNKSMDRFDDRKTIWRGSSRPRLHQHIAV